MKKLLSVFFIAVLFCACGKKGEERVEAATCEKPESEGFKMYKMSEMAALMEQMYVDNQRLRERIKNGDTIGAFPQHFLNIHRAAMTDDKDNDEFFKEQAVKFIKAQELIYKDSLNAQKHFNDAVDTCLKCHEQKCDGPIPRIRKLYLK